MGLRDLPEFMNDLMFLLRRDPRRGGNTNDRISSSVPSRTQARRRPLLTETHVHALHLLCGCSVPCSCRGDRSEPRYYPRPWTRVPRADPIATQTRLYLPPPLDRLSNLH